FLDCIFDCCSIRVADLRPSGQPWFNEVTLRKERDLLVELLDKIRALGARPDKAHLAAQNVDELRDLVDAGPADEISYPGDTRIAFLRPLRRAILLGVLPHRTELDDLECAPVLAHSLLRIKDRSRRFEFDGESDDNRNGERKKDADCRHQKVESAVNDIPDCAAFTAAGKDDPTRTQCFYIDLPRQAFIECGSLFDCGLSLQTDIKKLIDRHMSAAILERDDDAIDFLIFNNAIQLSHGADHFGIEQRFSDQVRIFRNESDDLVSKVSARHRFTRNPDGQCIWTDNEYPFTEFRMTHQPVDTDSPAEHQDDRNHHGDCRHPVGQPNLDAIFELFQVS